MRAWVAVTDKDWYRFLSRRPDLPGPLARRALPLAGPHRVDNGLRLRSDIHALFDQGYVTVTPDHRVLVGRRLKDDFGNGEPYYPLSGRRIWLPGEAEDQPSREFLEWHADTVYRG